MKWSSTLTSTSASACFSAWVSISSAWLGSATPDGWLWARITAAALWGRRLLDHFARIDAGLGQRAAKQFLDGDTRFWASRNSATKTSWGRSCQREPQVIAHRLRRSQRIALRAFPPAARAGPFPAPPATARIWPRPAGDRRRIPVRLASNSRGQAAEVAEQLARQIDRAFARHAGAQENRQQFGVGQRWPRPFAASFSRGRSSSGQSVIAMS